MVRVSFWFVLSVSSLLFIAPDRLDKRDRPDRPAPPSFLTFYLSRPTFHAPPASPARRARLALCPTEIHHSSCNIQHFPPPGRG
jgi:hypothetical protein